VKSLKSQRVDLCGTGARDEPTDRTNNRSGFKNSIQKKVQEFILVFFLNSASASAVEIADLESPLD